MPGSSNAGIIAAARKFFSLPEDAKHTCYTGKAARGWTPPGENLTASAEFVKQAAPSLQQKFAIGREWTRDGDDDDDDDDDDDRNKQPLPVAPSTAAVAQAEAAWYDPNTWPQAGSALQSGAAEEEAAWFRAMFEDYLQQMEAFTRTLLRVMEISLGVEEGWLAERCTEHYAKLDAIHYPPIVPRDLRLADADTDADATARAARQATVTTPGGTDAGSGVAGRGPEWSKTLDTRVSAHVDDSMLTILAHDHSAAGSEGLQMLVPPRPGGAWFDIPTVEGALVVQLGAIMQRWCGNDSFCLNFPREDYRLPRQALDILCARKPPQQNKCPLSQERGCLESDAAPCPLPTGGRRLGPPHTGLLLPTEL